MLLEKDLLTLSIMGMGLKWTQLVKPGALQYLKEYFVYIWRQ